MSDTAKDFYVDKEEELPLYNSQITKNYIEYLHNFYPDIDTDVILNYADMRSYQLEDGGHWFSQRQISKFHKCLSAMINNPELPRDVGRYVALSKSQRPLQQVTLGFVTPASAYRWLEKMYPLMSRASVLKVQSLSSNTVEVTNILKPGVAETPGQCQNRIGTFEAISMAFNKVLPTIDHSVCIHKGGDRCRYVISWENTQSYLWKKIRNYFGALSLVVCTVSAFFLPFISWIATSLGLLSVIMSLSFYSKHLEGKEYEEALKNEGKLANDVMDQMNVGYNNALTIQEIGQATSSILDIDELLRSVMDVFEKRLDFDRGMIMLTNKGRSRLVYTAGYGMDPHLVEYIKQTEFSLDKPHSQGDFVVVFKEQTPILVDDVGKIKNKLTRRSREFAEKLGSFSFICVPIVYEGTSEGVLVVDNISSKKPFSQSDLSLLMGIAPQIGISINNAKAYQLIREREESFRALSENAPDIIYTLDTYGIFTYVNPAWEKSLGHTKEEVIGKYFIDFAGKEAVSKFINTFKKIRDGRETIRDFTSALLHKNGSERLFNMTGAPNLDSEGNVIGLVGTFKDITEQHHLEMQLRQSHKMQAIGTLSGGIAHDFNNILTPIMGYTELMLAEVTGDSQIKWMLERVYNASRRAKDLVQQILTFSRQGEQEKKPVQVSIIVKETLKLLRSSLPATIDIRHNIQTQSLVMGDPTQIHQVVMNLCTNAGYAMQQDGGVLEVTLKDSISDEDCPILSSNTQRGSYMHLTVSDTGEGMAPEIIERIFDPFFTTKERTKGTGMGLSVVHGIVENLGGTITVESEPGKGSTFRVLFPLIEEAVVLESTADMAVTPDGHERILFIDDELPVVDIGKQILESLGYEVTTRTSSIEALELFKVRSNYFDLIITDMSMPNMPGDSLARHILNVRPDIPIIICTGYSTGMTREKVSDLGIGAIVMKPIIKNEMAHTIRQVLDSNKELRYATP